MSACMPVDREKIAETGQTASPIDTPQKGGVNHAQEHLCLLVVRF
jgi:hypothetical protein